MINNIKKFVLTKYVLLSCIFATALYTTPISNQSLDSKIEYYKQYMLSQEMLAFAIKDMEIQYPEWVYRQAMLESGGFKSRLAKTQNNLFGMKMPKRRQTYAEGSGRNNYAKYESWVHSVADYKLYQGSKIIKDYKRFLSSRKYSETSNYIKRLETIKIPSRILEILNS